MISNNDCEMVAMSIIQKTQNTSKLIKAYWIVFKLQQDSCLHSENRLSDESFILISINSIEEFMLLDKLKMLIKSAIYSCGFSCKEHYYLRFIKQCRESILCELQTLEIEFNDLLNVKCLSEEDAHRCQKLIVSLKNTFFSIDKKIKIPEMV